MKYVITGGAGFIGSNLVDKLVLDGNEVHVLDNFFSGRKENCNEHAYYHKIDISDESNLDQIVNILQNVDTVFHMACMARVQPSIINPIKFEKNNSLGTSIILKASVQAEARRFVYSSSSSVYGNNKIYPLLNLLKLIHSHHMEPKNIMVKFYVKPFIKFMGWKQFHYDILTFMEKNRILVELTH